MITEYGIHPLQDTAIAAHNVRAAIRELDDSADRGEFEDVVGLGTVRQLADVLCDALDRQWWATRPTLDQD